MAAKEWAERVPDWVLNQVDDITEISWEGADNTIVEGQRSREIRAHPEWNEINTRLFGMQQNADGELYFAPYSELLRHLHRERHRRISTDAAREENWIHPALAFESRADPSKVEWIRLGLDPVPSSATHQIRVRKKYQLLTHQDWETLLAQGKLPVDVSVFVSHDSAHIRDLFGDLPKMAALRNDARSMAAQPSKIREASRILDGQFEASFPLNTAERYYLRSWFVQEALVLPRPETAGQARTFLKEKFGIEVDSGLAQAVGSWNLEELYRLALWIADNESLFLRFSGAIHLDQFNFWTTASGKNSYNNLLERPESLEFLWRQDGVSSLKLENLRGVADAAQANLRWARYHADAPQYAEHLARGRDGIVAFLRGWSLGLELRLDGAAVVSESGFLNMGRDSRVVRWLDSYAPSGGLLREAYSLGESRP
jgi:hypothetical protein